MSDSKHLSPGTVIESPNGQYTIVRTLGSGGFGVTYLVETTITVGNIPMPMKFALKEHFMSDLCERGADTRQVTFSEPVSVTVERARKAFVKEATRLKSLGIDHPNIVRINEVFEANNTAYYVMEYLDGETLSEYIRRRGPLDVNQALALMRPVIDAVASLHAQNITHYDIKPANIMLAAGTQGKVRPVLIDFGLSKHYDDQGVDTSTNRMPGYTPGYSPIEQYAGLQEFTPQADVYSLAATLYTCLTGQKPPVASGTNANAMSAEIADMAPQQIVDAMRQALQFDQNMRTRDAAEFYAQLYDGIPVMPQLEREDTQRLDDSATQIYSNADASTVGMFPTPPAPPQIPSPNSQTDYDDSDNSDEDVEEVKQSGSNKWVWIIIILLLLGGAAGAGYYFWEKSKYVDDTPKTENNNGGVDGTKQAPATKDYGDWNQAGQSDIKWDDDWNQPAPPESKDWDDEWLQIESKDWDDDWNQPESKDWDDEWSQPAQPASEYYEWEQPKAAESYDWEEEWDDPEVTEPYDWEDYW